MDKKDIYHGNIIFGIILLGFGLFNFLINGKQPNMLAVFAAVLSMAIGLIGLKYLKNK